MTAPVFLAEPADLALAEFTFGGSEGRHAAAVRRLRAGERLDLTDGAGAVAECVVLSADRDSLRVEVLRRYEVPARALGWWSSRDCPRATGGSWPWR